MKKPRILVSDPAIIENTRSVVKRPLLQPNYLTIVADAPPVLIANDSYDVTLLAEENPCKPACEVIVMSGANRFLICPAHSMDKLSADSYVGFAQIKQWFPHFYDRGTYFFVVKLKDCSELQIMRLVWQSSKTFRSTIGWKFSPPQRISFGYQP